MNRKQKQNKIEENLNDAQDGHLGFLFVLFVSCIQYDDDGEDCDISNENQLLHYLIYKKLNPNFFFYIPN